MKNIPLILAAALLPVLGGCAQTDDSSADVAAAQSGEIDQSHADFTAILKKSVKGNGVDYAALAKNPAPLDSYVNQLAGVSEATFKSWSKDEQMAFLINLYNASTLKLIADNYPVKSIKDIGGLLKGPWKQPVVLLFGKKQTLDHVEHDLLRPNYNEARVHFAVNCASIGCPPLRAEAFTADKLDKQLDEQGREFLRDGSKNYLDAKNKTLHLSPIFKWFEEDFTKQSGSVQDFVLPFVIDADRKVIKQGGISIKQTDYDWNLNKL